MHILELSLQDCYNICNQNEAFIFKEQTINDYKVIQFNYLMASPSDFNKEYIISSSRKCTGHELRGITFVIDLDGNVERFLMLDKFFNVNETGGWMYDDLKDLTIASVSAKEDGSVVRFIKINDDWVAKSKFSFESNQAIMAQQLRADNYVRMMDFLRLNMNASPIYELVGPDNPIVLSDYTKNELRVIQIRNEVDGGYCQKETVEKVCKMFDVPYAKTFELTLDTMLELAVTQKNIEGWVIQFVSPDLIGKRAKLKTVWYCERHRILTGDGLFAHNVVKAVLDERADDMLAEMALDSTDSRHIFVEETIRKISHMVNHMYHEISLIIAEYDPNDVKEFMVKYQQHEWFSVIAPSAKRSNSLLDNIKTFISKKCSTKEAAERYLESIE